MVCQNIIIVRIHARHLSNYNVKTVRKMAKNIYVNATEMHLFR